MTKYTNYTSFEELLDKGNFKVETQQDFIDIPDDVFDKHISEHTKFNKWQDMLDKATQIHIEKNLKF